MNIFFLSRDPRVCAIWHCNEHCIKMILEYFQILSTTHRFLDGDEYHENTKNNRKIKRYRLGGQREKILYKATHINHPSCKWARQSSGNYKWLYKLTCFLCQEYTRRYHKKHASEIKLKSILGYFPKNITIGSMTPPPLAMPDEYKTTLDYPTTYDSIISYRIFYCMSKTRFATWFPGESPEWLIVL